MSWDLNADDEKNSNDGKNESQLMHRCQWVLKGTTRKLTFWVVPNGGGIWIKRRCIVWF